MNRLPKGYFPTDWNEWEGYWVNESSQEEKPLTKRCTCGSSITWGNDIPLEWHKDYCDLVRKNDPSKDS